MTIKELAQMAGVSPSLVSFVLNGKQKEFRISDEVAERVRRVAKETGYYPNGLAKGLREGMSRIIGVIVTEISNPFFSDVVNNITREVERAGYAAIFASCNESASRLCELTQKFLEKNVDGLIVTPCQDSEQDIAVLVNGGTPLVLIDRYCSGVNVSSVCLDNAGAARLLTNKLLERGYKRIVMVSHDLEVSCIKERINGFQQGISNSAEAEGSTLIMPFYDLESECDSVVAELDKNKCEAFLFASNTVATHFLKSLRACRPDIYQTAAFASIDGAEPFIFMDRPVIYITQPIKEISREAVQILLSRIRNSEETRNTVELQLPGSFAHNDNWQ